VAKITSFAQIWPIIGPLGTFLKQFVGTIGFRAIKSVSVWGASYCSTVINQKAIDPHKLVRIEGHLVDDRTVSTRPPKQRDLIGLHRIQRQMLLSYSFLNQT